MDTRDIDANCLTALCELESIYKDLEQIHNECLSDSFWNVTTAILTGRRSQKTLERFICANIDLHADIQARIAEKAIRDSMLIEIKEHNVKLIARLQNSVPQDTYYPALAQHSKLCETKEKIAGELKVKETRIHKLDEQIRIYFSSIEGKKLDKLEADLKAKEERIHQLEAMLSEKLAIPPTEK